MAGHDLLIRKTADLGALLEFANSEAERTALLIGRKERIGNREIESINLAVSTFFGLVNAIVLHDLSEKQSNDLEGIVALINEEIDSAAKRAPKIRIVRKRRRGNRYALRVLSAKATSTVQGGKPETASEGATTTKTPSGQKEAAIGARLSEADEAAVRESFLISVDKWFDSQDKRFSASVMETNNKLEIIDKDLKHYFNEGSMKVMEGINQIRAELSFSITVLDLNALPSLIKETEITVKSVIDEQIAMMLGNKEIPGNLRGLFIANELSDATKKQQLQNSIAKSIVQNSERRAEQLEYTSAFITKEVVAYLEGVETARQQGQIAKHT